MPNGSSGHGPLPPTFTTSNTTIITTTIDDTNNLSHSPPRKFLLSGPKPKRTASVDNVNMKAKIFGGPPASPTTTARPRTGHQTIRGRISGPIPMPNPLDDDEFPMRNPGTGIASSTPIENDMASQRLLQQPPPSKPSSPVTPGFAPAVAQTFPSTAGSGGGRVDIVAVPQTVVEHPSTPTQQPLPPHSSGTGTGPSGGPSPEGGASSVSGHRSSTTNNNNNNIIIKAGPRHRTNPSSSARYSAVSANSQKTGESPPDAAQNGPPQRKKSTLRSAIGKLLRRNKKKEGSLSSVSEIDRQAAIGGQHQQHRSVPPAARTVPSEHLITPRVTSMPISEFDRALRSHSIGPDDITAIESARNSMDILGSSPVRRRAATFINTNLGGDMVPRSRGGEWAGLSPRPASTHARGSRFTEEDPDAIGRAITSDGNGSDLGHKRRSRSLSQLNEVALEAAGRRRSDEIRYWRESYDVPGPLSPLSSGPIETETEANEENYELGGGRVSMSVAESAADRIPKTPPQPFHFGSVATMKDMVGMKITQAVTLEERFGNLEVRMIKLERVVDQLCHSVPGFKGPFTENSSAPPNGRHRSGSASAGAGVPTQHVQVSHPQYAYSNAVPPMIPAIYQTASPGPSRDGFVPSSRFTNTSRRSVETTTADDVSSRMSFGDGHTYIDSLHPPSSSATQAVSTVATSVPPVPGLLRPTSESTVRPVASMPSLGSQHGSASGGEERSSNSAALLAQLDQERAQRQLLEDQVRKLSERMNNLSTTMFAMVRDPKVARSNERLRPQTAHSSTSTSAAPTPPVNSNPHLAPIRTMSPAIAPSSKAQSIFGKEAVGFSPGSNALNSLASSPSKETAGGDDEFSDAFQTPREEPTPGGLTYSQAFGDEFGGSGGGYGAPTVASEETEEDLEERKKAARTLSLSQLTMGKGLPTRI